MNRTSNEATEHSTQASSAADGGRLRVLVRGDIESVLADAPTGDMLLRSLRLGEAGGVSRADLSLISSILGTTARPQNQTPGIVTTGDGVSVDAEHPRVREALAAYQADVEILRHAVELQYQEIAATISLALAAMGDARAATAAIPLRAEIHIKDTTGKDELQRVGVYLNLYQEDAGEDRHILHVFLFSVVNLAWNSFQSKVHDDQTNIFTSGLSPLRSLEARKVRLMAAVVRLLSRRVKNKSGDDVTFIHQDLQGLKVSEPAGWRRLTAALAGEPVREIKAPTRPGIVDVADRGDGGMSGSAKDVRRFARAIRRSADVLEAVTMEDSALKGNIAETLTVIGDVMRGTLESMSLQRLREKHAEAFMIQNGESHETLFPEIFNAADSFLESYRGQTNHMLYKLATRTPLERLRSRLIQMQTMAVPSAGSRLVKAVEMAVATRDAIKSFWTEFENLIGVVRGIRSLVQNDVMELRARGGDITAPFFTAQALKHGSLVEVGRAALVQKLTAVLTACEELRGAAVAVAQTLHEDDMPASSESTNGSLVAFSDILKALATDITTSAEAARTTLTSQDDLSPSTRASRAMAQFIKSFGAVKDPPLQDYECAILKATEMRVVDWSAGEREDFPEWMSEPARVREVFNLKNTEFGASISANRRQLKNALLKVSVSMQDLSTILGVEPSQLSLGGRLAISVGARGQQSSIAHFDPKRSLMVFKNGEHGDGAFIHEWFHAFDMTGTGESGLKQSTAGEGAIDEDVREAMRELNRVIVTGDREVFARQVDCELVLAVGRCESQRAALNDLRSQEEKFKTLARDMIANIQLTTDAAARIIQQVVPGVDQDQGLKTEDFFLSVRRLAVNATLFRAAGLGDVLDAGFGVPASPRIIERKIRDFFNDEAVVTSTIQNLSTFFKLRDECLESLARLTSGVDQLYERSRRGLLWNAERKLHEASHTVADLRQAKEVLGQASSYADFLRLMRRSRLPSSLVLATRAVEDLGSGWPSKMLLDSQIADRVGGKKHSYFASVEEMGARAFEVYGAKKMTQAGLRNTFLIDEIRAGGHRDESGPQIYPSGAHAERIEEAFDALIAVMRRKGRLNIR